MANPFTPPNINFNVYERENPIDQQVNWAEIAQNITTAVTDIEKDRAKRKKKIEKSYRKQQEKILELNNKYDTRTLQQWVNSGVMSTGEQLAAQYNLLTRGMIKESEFSLTQNNAKAGYKSIKSYANSYNKRMNEFTERRKTKMENGQPISSAEEAYDVETLLMFNNLNNKKLETDRLGNLSVLTIDTQEKLEDGTDNPNFGNPIEGQSATVQQLEGLLYQETNNIDVTKVLENLNNQLGTLSMDFAGQTKSGYRDLTETERVAADVRFLEALGDKDSERHKEAAALLEGLVNEMVYDEFVAATYAVNNGVKTKDGDLIKLGTKDEFDKFAQDNPGKVNPIIVRDYNKNSGMVQSFTTDDQVNSVKDWARGAILGSFNAKVKRKAERVSTTSKQVKINVGGNVDKVDYSVYETLQDTFNLTGNEDGKTIDDQVKLAETILNQNISDDQPSLEVDIKFETDSASGNTITKMYIYQQAYESEDGTVERKLLKVAKNPMELSNEAVNAGSNKENYTLMNQKKTAYENAKGKNNQVNDDGL